MSKLIRFGVAMDGGLLKRFDRLISRRGYANRSEALRDLVRREFVAEEWADGKAEAVGTITLVYDHGTRELDAALVDIQHHNHRLVVSSMHVHLTAHMCMEVLAVRGKAKAIRALADRLIATRGVRHGTLAATTTARALA